MLFLYTGSFLHEVAGAIERSLFRSLTSPDFNFLSRVVNSIAFCIDSQPAEHCLIAKDDYLSVLYSFSRTFLLIRYIL